MFVSKDMADYHCLENERNLTLAVRVIRSQSEALWTHTLESSGKVHTPESTIVLWPTALINICNK